MGEQLKRILLSVMGGAYVLSPIDIIPDIIPLLGQADDLAVILLMIYLWMSWMRDDKTITSRTQTPEGPVIDVKPVE